MANSSYVTGRQRYKRPQAMLWSDTPGTLSNGIYVPSGYEKGSDLTSITTDDYFLILSDHNRADISVNPQRIEQRQRMINGTMRSYHVADKLTISTSWTSLPSRSYKLNPQFDQTTGKALYDHGYGSSEPLGTPVPDSEYTADGGAGGVEMLDWYENHKGPFWVFLAYDKYNNFGEDNPARLHLAEYNQVVQMYFANFSYTIAKRGGNTADHWNISVTLEEV